MINNENEATVKCPYCNGNMMRGWLCWSHRVIWTQNKEKKITGWLGPNDISLSGSEFSNAFLVKTLAYRCQNCRKMIIDN